MAIITRGTLANLASIDAFQLLMPKLSGTTIRGQAKEKLKGKIKAQKRKKTQLRALKLNINKRRDMIDEGMGWMMGLEPTTTGITIRGSTTELHPPQPKNWERINCHWGG